MLIEFTLEVSHLEELSDLRKRSALVETHPHHFKQTILRESHQICELLESDVAL